MPRLAQSARYTAVTSARLRMLSRYLVTPADDVERPQAWIWPEGGDCSLGSRLVLGGMCLAPRGSERLADGGGRSQLHSPF
jgi:hypothetical protein